jgi:hypothetical protein
VETATGATSNVYLDGNGHLVIKPIKDAAGNWTSGRIDTRRADFQAPAGGQLAITASIRQPDPASGAGYWPAFRAVGAASHPASVATRPGISELDVMEDVNALSEESATFRCGTDSGNPCQQTAGLSSGLVACGGCQTGYHTYAVVIDRTNAAAEQVRFTLDGKLIYAVNESLVGRAAWQAAVDHGFFLSLGVAVGGTLPNMLCGCVSPSAATSSGAGMSVAYVAVYQSGGGSASPQPSTAKPAATTARPAATTARPAATTARPTATTARPPSSPPPASRTSALSSAPSPVPAPSPTAAAPACAPGGGTGGSAYSPIPATAHSACYAVAAEPTSDDPTLGGSQDLAQLAEGAWAEYPRVDFGSSGATQFYGRVASGAPAAVSGMVQVHLDSLANPPVGSFSIASTGGWQVWRTVPANIATVTGVHDVFLSFFSGQPAPFVSLHWLEFGP